MTPIASIGGLLILFASPWHLYVYHNPYLTDAFGLAALSLMLFGIVRNSFLMFAIAAIIGVLARETCIFLVPVWFLKNLRQGMLVASTTISSLLILRSDPTLGSASLDALQWDRLLHPVRFATEIALSWRHAWIYAIAGVYLFRDKQYIELGAAFLLPFFGALLTSLIATDLGRMFAILSPIVAVAAGRIFLELSESGYSYVVYLLVGMSLVGSLLIVPNSIFGEEIVLGGRAMKLTAFLGNAALGICATLLVRENVRAAWKQRMGVLPAVSCKC